MKALVFAAGLGTRLRPLTSTRPKALVEVGGKTLLYHVIKKLQDSSISDITVNVHHFPDMIISYLGDTFGEGIHISDERDLLRETGGGILHARKYLEGDNFLVHNVDILSNLDLRTIPLRDNSPATLVVSQRNTSRYLLFDRDMRLVGWTNTATGEVRSPWPGLDPSRCRHLAFAGIHLLSKDIFPLMESFAPGERFPVMDFYLSACRDHAIYGYEPAGFRMLDVGKPETLPLAESFLEGKQ